MKVTEETNIVQSNFLIEIRPALTKDETRLFLTIIATINRDDSEFEFLQVPVKEFADLWSIDTKNAYQQIKDAVVGLQNKHFLIEGINPETGKQRFLTSSSLSAASYEEGQGYLSVEISKMFRPYLLDLKEKYTIYVLQNIMDLASVSSIRLYELLKQYQSIGKREFLFVDLKHKLQMEDKYPDNTDFRRYVIEPSVSEVNEKTDIFATYEYSGRGKKATVSFTIKSKKQLKQVAPEVLAEEAPVISELEDEIKNEIDFLRSALTDPNSLTDEQLDECISLARDTDWYKSYFNIDGPMEKLLRLKDYLQKQDKYTRANCKKSFYGYFRLACAENYADVAGYKPLDEAEPHRYGNFDVNEAYQTALERSYGDDYEKLFKD